ncbi:MAG: carboxy terminal-processing peptidase [Spirosomataceae bacterium]
MRKYLITLIPVIFMGGNIRETDLSDFTSVQSPNDGVFEDLKPTLAQYKAQSSALRLLNNFHFRKIKLDDSLSSVILDKYLKDIDPGKMYFTQEDIDKFEKYRYSFDDFLLKGELDVPYEIFNLYRRRWLERNDFISEVLKNPKLQDFTTDEVLEVDRENRAWAANTEELDQLWFKYLKSEALDLKLTGKADTASLTILQQRYKNRARNLGRIKTDQAFQTYFNAYAESIDPHTSYMSPVTADRFNQDMSQSLEGIGAQLREDGNYIKIVDIIPGGPAFKSNYFKKEDRIIGVAQGDNGPMVDIVGWFVDDAVKLIKGPKGTVVRLQILPADALPNTPPKEYRLVREKINLVDGRAKKDILTVPTKEGERRLGVITVPQFYRDFEGVQRREKGFASTTNDVKKLINELKEEGIDGLIVDLRNNGGGSLYEAVAMTGLFIKSGPVVQIKETMGQTDVQSDPDPTLVYDGPLAVMVNRFSASASEIFAAAIQDYKRGIVIGEQTFGKGTVQTLLDLNQYERSSEPLGRVKMTTAKFYRVNGSSTQLKGVEPDIELPAVHLADEYREQSQSSALPWDQINPVRYEATNDISESLLKWLNENHGKRLQSDEKLIKLVKDLELFREARENKVISLNEEKRKKEREEAEKKRLALSSLNQGNDLDDEENENTDDDQNTKDAKNDVYLEEAGRIVNDMIAFLKEPSLVESSKTKKR